MRNNSQYRIKRPSACWVEDLDVDVDGSGPSTIEVIEVGRDSEPTGLLDKDGNSIYRIRDRMGFLT